MSPRTPEQYEEIRKHRRRHIMGVALVLFARKGFHSTSISQIAKAAKVSKGLIYNYFDSKDHLLEQLIVHEVQQGPDLLDILAQQTSDPYEQLTLLLDGAFQMIETDLTHWKLMTMLSLQEGIMQRMSSLFRKKVEDGMSTAIRIFERMGVSDPLVEAYLFGASMDGIFLHYLTMRDLDVAYPLAKLKKNLINRYRNHTTSNDEK
ncbi:MAG: TetR/AcrR family transcriptional regulator [Saprospiraceae bacterium]|nr:TetR/AcrR family transcriptional regulator [Saprospiraceae bacterium]